MGNVGFPVGLIVVCFARVGSTVVGGRVTGNSVGFGDDVGSLLGLGVFFGSGRHGVKAKQLNLFGQSVSSPEGQGSWHFEVTSCQSFFGHVCKSDYIMSKFCKLL